MSLRDVFQSIRVSVNNFFPDNSLLSLRHLEKVSDVVSIFIYLHFEGEGIYQFIGPHKENLQHYLTVDG